MRIGPSITVPVPLPVKASSPATRPAPGNSSGAAPAGSADLFWSSGTRLALGAPFGATLRLKGFEGAGQELALRRATHAACEALEKALRGLGDEATWQRIKAEGTKGYLEPGGRPKGVTDWTIAKLSEPGVRESWLARLRSTLSQVRSSGTTVPYRFDPSYDSGNETILYTRFYGVGSWGVNGLNMNVTRRFFDLDPASQAERVKHELGRWFPKLGGSGGDPEDPISLWDRITDYLAARA